MRQRPLVDRDLQAGITHASAKVLPVQCRQPPPDVHPHPQERLERGIDDIGGQVLGDVQIGFLQHVRSVDPRPQPRIHAQLDHPAQPIAVAIKDRRERTFFAGAKPAEQASHLAFGLVDVGSHLYLSAHEVESGTEENGKPGK